MQRLAIHCALACSAALPVLAQGNADLMKTPACLAARQQLDAALAASGPRERLAAARERAALACFGVKPAAPPEGRFVPPPVATEPIRLRPETALAPPPAARAQPAPLPQLPVPRAPAVTTCDAAGCWDSNGTHYDRQGPVLLGPRGVCTMQGGVMNCP
ncbi:hypothetical protein ACFPOE_23805 [Caenimonas terrae]|uniref:DUF3761 domain-containing protein n=1 Tax=Caenimonas terrae TaxID=696074 RepID=A0ABW0NNX4_9BURK